MTIFIASLFLPYTINFEVPPSLPPSPEISRPVTSCSENITPSLLNKIPVPPLVQTPGATTDHERIFIPQAERLFKLTMPSPLREAQTLNRPATTPDLRDPRFTPRTDMHSPAWGKAFTWNQPSSRAKSPPPSSVLRHNAIKESTATKLWRASTKYRARQRSRTQSHESHFTHENWTVKPAQLGNGGLYVAVDAVSESKLMKEKTWVGTLGMPTDALNEHLKQNISEKLEDDYESLTVFVDDSDFNGHYEHYCKTILWPIFHYQIPDHPKSKAYEDHSWIFYVKVNEAFAERIIKNYKKGDIVWIHDYHLLLVPGMIRKKLPDAQIGFFLHSSFPSSEIFRCLAVRTDLLEGILGANMIGFQTEEYGHHFLQTCCRLLNVEATKQGVILEDGRFVHVNNFPMGIDAKSLDHQRSLPEVSEWVNTILEKYKGKRIIVARDKLDNIRGVRQKMLSYELFLNRYPKYRDQVVLIQIATSGTEDSELSATVADIVTRINSTHSTLAHQPVVFLKQDIDLSQYLALLTVAECLMITSLREGMNLTSHEFIYCQDGRYGRMKWSPLILSEFTGAATVLENSALLVNPWDYSHCAEAIRKALDMSYDERKCRWHNMYGTIMHHNATQWYTTYMDHLKIAYEEHTVRDSTAVPRLAFPALKTQYEQAAKRLLILDYEGTLASWGAPTDIILTTPQRAIDVLTDLVEDDKNIVYVMSGRMPEELERLFRLVLGLGLIAENGAFLREAGKDDWIELTDLIHVSDWKKGVRSILQYYAERIEGSKIEERQSALIFDYSDAEDIPGAFKQAGECANHINDACQRQFVHAVPIENGIAVSDLEINKGAATTLISDNLTVQMQHENQPMPDFLLVIGDSREDEYVFSWADKLQKKGLIRDVCTVTLGARNTGASHTLTQGVTGVLSTLKKLAVVSQVQY